LKAQDVHVSRKRVVRLMQAQGLQGRCRRSRVRTTDSRHNLPVAPNLLDQDFTADGPNEKWVGDVTYLRTPEGWLYLAVVLDLYSRFVVGWALSPVNDRHLALKALDMAVQRRRPGQGLLAHTDQGSPYASEDYQKALSDLGIECSMSRKGNCYDNAAMESFFARLKVELGEFFESHADAWRQVFEFLEVFYNQERLHSSNGFQSPAEFERQVFA
jgi:transposase InsO family protein